MNTQLVKTLAQIIKSLSEEERSLLETELNPQSDWETTKKRIIERNKISRSQRGGQPLNPSPEEIIRQSREERTEQLMQAIVPDYPIKTNDL